MKNDIKSKCVFTFVSFLTFLFLVLISGVGVGLGWVNSQDIIHKKPTIHSEIGLPEFL